MATLSWSERLTRRIVAGGGKRGALGVIALLSIGDFFVPALPTQTSVIALSLLQPRRAAWIVLVFAAAAAVGVFLMALLLGLVDGYVQRLVTELSATAWTEAASLLRRHGVWIVLAASIFPTPPRVLVAAALLAGSPAGMVGSAVFVGKLIWLGVLVTLIVRSPHYLARIPWLGARIQGLRELQHRIALEDRS